MITHKTTQNRKRKYTNLYILSYFLVFLFVLFSVPGALAAELFIFPQSGTFVQDETFFADLRLDTQGEQINAVEARLNFPPDALQVVNLEAGGSLISLWPGEPAFDNTQGTIVFAGGTPAPFIGQDGLIGRILFRAKATGQNFSLATGEGSQVLLADGRGTPAKLTTLPGVFDVLPAQPSIISSPSHPDQLKWSRERTLVLRWAATPGTEWSYNLIRDPTQEPDDTPDEPQGDIKFESLEDGIYYFVLKQVQNNPPININTKPISTNISGDSSNISVNSWGTNRYRAMIDGTPPEQFEVKFSQGQPTTKGYPFLSFNAVDGMSGIRSFALCGEQEKLQIATIDAQESQACREVTSPVILTKQERTAPFLTILAFDLAGNIGEAALQVPPLKPPLKESVTAIIIGIAFLIGVALLSRIARVRSALKVLLWKASE